ncbi:uncharacterized protein METZ01_LOCUS409752 [marine metagenome]|uniref:Uncharacterized protein n=1 Tax=marine metagenome TaxID=408172 RepID=A0A382WFK7_9ZZZZ
MLYFFYNLCKKVLRGKMFSTFEILIMADLYCKKDLLGSFNGQNEKMTQLYLKYYKNM